MRDLPEICCCSSDDTNGIRRASSPPSFRAGAGRDSLSRNSIATSQRRYPLGSVVFANNSQVLCSLDLDGTDQMLSGTQPRRGFAIRVVLE